MKIKHSFPFAFILFSFSSFAADFTFRIAGEPQSLDWHLGSTLVETPFFMNEMEGLTEVDKNLKTSPALAQNIATSADGKTLKFTLRSPVKWSDGKPLIAQHFVDGWNRLKDPKTAAPYAYLLDDVESFDASAPDTSPQIFTVRLKKPVAFFTSLTAFWPLFPIRKDLIDQHGKAWIKPENRVTIGAYTVSKITPQVSYEMRPNPHYWRKRGNIDKVTALIVKESSTALRLFEEKRIDVLSDLSPDDLKKVQTRKEFRVFPYLKVAYVAFRLSGTQAHSPLLRKAIAQAIDPKAIVTALGGHLKPASSYIPPSVLGHSSQIGIRFDLNAAKKSIAQLAPPLKSPLQLVARTGESPRLTTQVIQDQIKRGLGIDVAIQQFDHKGFRSQIMAQNYDMMLMTWSADYPDPDSFTSMFESMSGNNYPKLRSAQYDEWSKKGRETLEKPVREKLYKDAQKLLQETEIAILPLYYDTNRVMVRKSVKDFVLNPIGTFFIRDVVRE